MAVIATEADKATKADERPEREEAGTEVMMAPAVPVDMTMAPVPMPEAPTVDLLHQRRGLYLLRHASDRSRHR
jgi:hypothetical protein